MIELYHGTGACDFEVLEKLFDKDEMAKFRTNLRKVLLSRGDVQAVEILDTYRFWIYEGTNHFGDEFQILYASLPLNQYEAIRISSQDPSYKISCSNIAEVSMELGTYIRFIAVEFEQTEPNKLDCFICHATEDKESVAKPLAEVLEQYGISSWIDEYEFTMGDGLRREMDRGLLRCDFGVVVLSHAFFSKDWPQIELDGLYALEVNHGRKKILPVRHNIEIDEIIKFSPIIAGKFIVSTSIGIVGVALEIIRAIKKSNLD